MDKQAFHFWRSQSTLKTTILSLKAGPSSFLRPWYCAFRSTCVTVQEKGTPPLPASVQGQVGWGFEHWSSGRCLCPRQGDWNKIIFKVPSNTNHSMILWGIRLGARDTSTFFWKSTILIWGFWHRRKNISKCSSFRLSKQKVSLLSLLSELHSFLQ